MTLFEQFNKKEMSDSEHAPLAEKMRPLILNDFIGQDHLTGEGRVLSQIIESDKFPSMIFWGPPGSGKTTIARIIQANTKNRFISFSAVTASIKQIKEVMDIASYEIKQKALKTVLFIDEIHRFNKAQQDAFLPFVENGTIILIGATTENPSFEINSALLSRCKVFIFNKLQRDSLEELVKRAIADKERGLGKLNIEIDKDALEFIAQYSDGDARTAYNVIELCANTLPVKKGPHLKITQKEIEEVIQKKMLLYDKNAEEHYNLISALHKSMRGSDADASAYWTMRMIDSGEDPLYILRRIIRFAAEDIGLADPNALIICVNAKNAFEFLGPPEGHLAILQASIYCALAPKSNAVYKTSKAVQEDIAKFLSLPVPMHIRNAPTKLMKEAGYGKGYKYAHDYKDAIAAQQFLPDELKGRKYYNPTERGNEKLLKERISKIEQYKENILKKQK